MRSLKSSKIIQGGTVICLAKMDSVNIQETTIRGIMIITIGTIRIKLALQPPQTK